MTPDQWTFAVLAMLGLVFLVAYHTGSLAAERREAARLRAARQCPACNGSGWALRSGHYCQPCDGTGYQWSSPIGPDGESVRQ